MPALGIPQPRASALCCSSSVSSCCVAAAAHRSAISCRIWPSRRHLVSSNRAAQPLARPCAAQRHEASSQVLHEAGSQAATSQAALDTAGDKQSDTGLPLSHEQQLDSMQQAQQNAMPKVTLASIEQWPDLVSQVEERVGELSALGNTILFSLGLILIDYGLEEILNTLLGEDDVVGAVGCIVAGLSMVVWARLSGFKMLGLWSPNADPNRDQW